jgi:hypothetical protein
MNFSLRALSLVSCAAALLAAAPVAQADTFTITPAPSGLFTGGPLASVSGTVTSTVIGGGTRTFNATYASAVFTDSITHDLDFVYSVKINSTTNSDIIDGLSMSDFDGFLQSIVADTTSGVAPDSIANELNGTVNITFNTAGGLTAGESSETIGLRTNATNFASGTFSAIDDSVANFQGFQPAAATPEPSSIVLFGSGLLAAAGAIRRRMTV